VLAADATEAWNQLVAAQGAGHGSVPMFVGKLDPWGNPAEITINEVLADPDLLNANTWAAAEVANQLDQLAIETGVQPSEIVSAPFLMFEYSGYLVAWVPGLVNGVVLPNEVYAPPDPHGPEIGGSDLFKDLLDQNLGAMGYTNAWVEDWDLYHIYAGEVHCGSNATHELPAEPWWENMP
jgi:protein-arginine deiminase